MGLTEQLQYALSMRTNAENNAKRWTRRINNLKAKISFKIATDLGLCGQCRTRKLSPHSKGRCQYCLERARKSWENKRRKSGDV
jgi:hypothetical protein